MLDFFSSFSHKRWTLLQYVLGEYQSIQNSGPPLTQDGARREPPGLPVAFKCTGIQITLLITAFWGIAWSVPLVFFFFFFGEFPFLWKEWNIALSKTQSQRFNLFTQIEGAILEINGNFHRKVSHGPAPHILRSHNLTDFSKYWLKQQCLDYVFPLSQSEQMTHSSQLDKQNHVYQSWIISD